MSHLAPTIQRLVNLVNGIFYLMNMVFMLGLKINNSKHFQKQLRHVMNL